MPSRDPGVLGWLSASQGDSDHVPYSGTGGTWHMKPTVVLKSFEALPSIESPSINPTSAPAAGELANQLPDPPELAGDGRRILVPVDDSTASAQILGWGVALAAHLGSRVALLQVVAPGLTRHDPIGGPLARTEADAELTTSRHLVHLVRERIPFCRRGGALLRVGKLEREIVAAADEKPGNFLVLATDVHADSSDLLSCRTVGRIIRQTPCPTFVVPLTVLAQRQAASAVCPSVLWRRVFVPVDLSDTSAALLSLAATLAGPAAAEVLLFYVPGLYGNDPRVGHGHRSPFRVGVPEAIEQRLWAWARQHVPARLSVSALSETGIAGADVIARVAKRENCDLVVVGCQPESWWHRLVEGSVAEGLVRLGRSLLLVVPQPIPGTAQGACANSQASAVEPSLLQS